MISTTHDIAASLEFLTGWQERQTGAIRPGGKLIIRYDPERLTACRSNLRGAEAWDIEVFVVFHPGRQFIRGEVLEKIRDQGHGPIVKLRPKPFEVDVPRDAREVELWFRNYYTVRSLCEAWDSRYGRNYRFRVEST